MANINPGEHPDYIIVGLGNPGQRYENTRHNIGFKVVDYIDSKSFVSRGCKRMLHSSLCDKCVLDGHIIYNVKPQTFMNNSGMAVQDVMNYYNIKPNHLIVIHDDIKLPVGEFRVKFGGSANGHNGLKSIIQHIGTGDFIRIRVGVGIKPEGWDMSKYVLSKISNEEMALISEKFEWIKRSVSNIFNYGLEYTLKVSNIIGANKVD